MNASLNVDIGYTEHFTIVINTLLVFILKNRCVKQGYVVLTIIKTIYGGQSMEDHLSGEELACPRSPIYPIMNNSQKMESTEGSGTAMHIFPSP